MKNTRALQMLCLSLVILLVIPAALAAQDLAPLDLSLLSGLPETDEPEQILPGGAIAYLRANNLHVLLENIDSFLTGFVPEKALPPQFQSMFANPQPFLAFLTTQFFGEALPLSNVPDMIGMALNSPISVALYPMPPAQGMLLSLPIGNPAVMPGLLANLIAPREIEQGRIGEVGYYRITPMNPYFSQDVYLMANSSTVFICGSREVAQMLVNSANTGTMTDEPIMAKSIAKYAQRDLTLVLSPGIFKAQLPFIKQQAATLPGPAFKEIRDGLEEIPAADRMMFDARLRGQFGIHGLDQLVDYAEAYSSGMYRVLLDHVTEFMMNVNGLALSINIEKTLQTLALTVYSLDLQPQRFTQALPMDDVKEGLRILPGDKNHLFAFGQAPESEPSVFFTAILNAIEEELLRKGLPMDGFLAYKAYYQAKAPCSTLRAQAPWTLKTILATAEPLDFSQFSSLWDLFNATMKRFSGNALWLPVTLMPSMAEGIIENHFARQAEQLTKNGQAYRAMRQKLPFQQPLFTTSSRFMQEDVGEKLKQLTFERSYTTRRGYFGYQEHEWINRNIMFHKSLPEYELLYDANAENERLDELINAEPATVPASVQRLLDQVPAEAMMLSLFHNVYLLEDVLNFLTKFEALAHREMDAFLADVQELVNKSEEDDPAELLLKAGLDLPLLVSAIHVNDDGEVYALLPGGLHYPRHVVMPKVSALFRDILNASSDVGGCVSYLATQPGELEMANAQSTDALALLVKTVVNNFYDVYMNAPDGMQTLMNDMTHPGDFKNLSEDEIFKNPLWEALEDEGFPFTEKLLESKQDRTKADMRAIGTALGSYMVDMNYFPSHQQLTSMWDVDLPNDYYAGSYMDGWDMPYYYISAASGWDYALISYGKDGVPGSTGSDADADIVFANGQFVAPEEDAWGDGLDELMLKMVGENELNFVRTLLELGADPDAETDSGDSALSLAQELEFDEMSELLKEFGAEEE